MSDSVTIYFDGGARGTPGLAAGGAILYDAAGNTIRHLGQRIECATNNFAEWTGLLIGLRAARELGGVRTIKIKGDSNLVISQLSKGWGVQKSTLVPLVEEGRALAAEFERRSAMWVPRKENRAADFICNAVMDGRYQPDMTITNLPETAEDDPISVGFFVETLVRPEDVAALVAEGLSIQKIRARFAKQIAAALEEAAGQQGSGQSVRVTRVAS